MEQVHAEVVAVEEVEWAGHTRPVLVGSASARNADTTRRTFRVNPVIKGHARSAER